MRLWQGRSDIAAAAVLLELARKARHWDAGAALWKTASEQLDATDSSSIEALAWPGRAAMAAMRTFSAAANSGVPQRDLTTGGDTSAGSADTAAWAAAAPGYPHSPAFSMLATRSLATSGALMQAVEWAGRYFTGLLDVVPVQGETALLTRACEQAAGLRHGKLRNRKFTMQVQDTPGSSIPDSELRLSEHSVLPISNTIADSYGLREAMMATRAAAQAAEFVMPATGTTSSHHGSEEHVGSLVDGTPAFRPIDGQAVASAMRAARTTILEVAEGWGSSGCASGSFNQSLRAPHRVVVADADVAVIVTTRPLHTGGTSENDNVAAYATCL